MSRDREPPSHAHSKDDAQHNARADAIDPTADRDASSETAFERAPIAPVRATSLSMTTNFDERYARGELLGEGGMGTVTILHDKVIGRDVAMKVIRPEHRGRADITARFLREARVQGQLEHPAIVPVYELGITPDGAAYFTMKRLGGTTLKHAIARARADDGAEDSARFTLRRLLSAFSNVCLAVDFAHSRGVIHRDLKPENIVLGDFGEVYVLDWGVAKLTSGPQSDVVAQHDERLDTTRPGTLLGSLGYMPPEQLRGATDEVDPRADVYALGAILFEILTLEKLHRGRKSTEIIYSTMVSADRSPAARRPDRNIAIELDQLVLAATEPERARRLSSARALSNAIERYLDGDRDVERRRIAASEHATRARDHVLRALEQGASPELEQRERAAAMREVGAALGLDANNDEAKRALVTLLETPMRAVPDEARAALEAAQLDVQQRTSRWGAAAFGSFFFLLPMLLWMGVRAPAIVAVLFAMMALGSAGYAHAALRRRERATMPGVVLLAGFVGLLLVSGVLGPLWVPPLLATVNAMGLVLTSNKSRRPLLLALSVLSVLVPIVLQQLGALPRSYEFMGETLVVRSWLVRFSPLATEVALTLFSVTVIAASIVLVGRFRDMLTDAEERQVCHAWQLRQIVR